MKIRFLAAMAGMILLAGVPAAIRAQTSVNFDSLRQYILTPPPPQSPRINGARVFGVRPGSTFLYTLPATGKRPMTFSAEGLPRGLKLDPATGRVTGVVNEAGEYRVIFKATNALGSAEKDFRIIVGEKIALTPPLGWNSWNCWGNAVSQEKVLSSARAMAEKGLIDHGWTYINIDDGWQGVRGGAYDAIQPNDKFPDMKGLADEIHGLGLKIGIYSGPWVGTYAGHIGSYSDNADGTYDWIEQGIHNEYYRFVDTTGQLRHSMNYHHGKYSFVANDVRQWAEWGIDYLKYDWNPNDYYHVKEMMEALRAQKRDIVYSLSNSAPYGDAVLWEQMANCWRTTGDIRDNWKSMSGIGFNQTKWAPYVGPGHWADPDMLVVGMVGWGPRLHYTQLNADEQYTHITLWSLLGSPLLIGCDMAQLDDFTLSLLTNDEVLDVSQDPLGKFGMQITRKEDVAVYCKPLEDGAMAVGIFNLGDETAEGGFALKEIGIRGMQTVRDLWRQKDLIQTDNEFTARINPHGVVFVKVYPGNSRMQATSDR